MQSFVPETFWYIYLSLSRRRLGEDGQENQKKGTKKGKAGEDDETTEFAWRRVRLFDFTASLAIYEHVLSNPLARVTKKNSKGTKKW